MVRGIGDIPLDLPVQHYNVLRDMREMILELRGTLAPPSVPSNLTITPQAFSNRVQFSRSTDADFYEVRHSQTPNSGDATAVIAEIGPTTDWVDQVGNVGIAKTYWVRAAKATGARSAWSPSASGTTLASNAGVTPPAPPPAGRIIVIDQNTGQDIPYDLARDQIL